MLPPFFYTGSVFRQRPVYLVGMMGVGKSTIGPLLARELACAFFDTDVEVEREAGRSISELFADEGEHCFRERERVAIERLSRTPAVVALGGGAVVQPGVLDLLRGLGDIVYLKASPEALLARLGDTSSRPLLAGLPPYERMMRLRALLNERRPCYEQADYVIDAEGAETEVVGRILQALGVRRE